MDPPKLHPKLEEEVLTKRRHFKYSLLSKALMIFSSISFLSSIFACFTKGFNLINFGGVACNLIIITALLRNRQVEQWTNRAYIFFDFGVLLTWFYYIIFYNPTFYFGADEGQSGKGRALQGMSSMVFVILILNILGSLFFKMTVVAGLLVELFSLQEIRANPILYFLLLNLGFLCLLSWLSIFFDHRGLTKCGKLFEEIESTAKIHNVLHEGIAIFASDGNNLFSNPSFRSLLSLEEEQTSSFDKIADLLTGREAVITERVNGPDTLVGISGDRSPEIFCMKKSMNFVEEKSMNFLVLRDLMSEFVVEEVKNAKRKPRVFDIRIPDLYVADRKADVHLELQIAMILYRGANAVLLTLFNTTQTKELTRVKNLDEYKDILLASVTHELRTPLNCIIPLVTKAIETEGTTAQVKQELLQPALNSGKLLLSLVNDIIDYSKLKRKGLTLVFEMFDFRQKAREIITLFEFQAMSKGLRLRLNIDEAVPDKIFCEPNRLFQIVINFLSNAFKFTKKGEITLHAKMVANRRLRIAVEDTGIGIKEEDRSKLFKLFGQLEAVEHTRMNHMGAGLGLIISNSLVRLLGGDCIQVESNYKEGSTFSIEVPIERNTSEVSIDENVDRLDVANRVMNPFFLQVHENEEDNVISCICRRVLIVDDNEYNLLALDVMLKTAASLEAVRCFDGDQALSILKSASQDYEGCGKNTCSRFRLIISDLNMPIMNGFELLQQYRIWIAEQDRLPIPFAICSAFDTEKEMKRGFELGMNDYLSKPMSQLQVTCFLKKYRLC